MSKVIRLSMSDGSVWEIPAHVVADHRATYYAELDGSSYQVEYDLVLENASELLDWAGNNMDWTDVKQAAKRVRGSLLDFDEEWRCADMTVGEQRSEPGDLNYELVDDFAGRLYERYCEAVGGTAWNGDPLPTWAEFGSGPQKEKQANGWREVARAALGNLGQLGLRAFQDGNMIAVVKAGFVDLQESKVVAWLPVQEMT